MLRVSAVVVCALLGLALVAASSSPSAVTLFDAKGGHNTADNLRQCYDTMRRAAACPLSKRKNQQQQTIVGTRRSPLVCAPDEVDGTFMIRVTYMLLRTISKSSFVKNAYFTGPVNGEKPTHQHFLDVFLGQLVFNVLNAAERSVIESLARQPKPDPEEARVKAAWEQLALPQNMWASVKWGTFSGRKERMAMGSKAFRDAIRTIRTSKKPLFRTCRRVKFVIASMDVGADVAKYALARKWAIATLIKKIITTIATIGAAAVPIGGQAVGALVGVVSDLVDSYIDASKEQMNRKYAVQDIVLQLLSAMIPPKDDTPPLEAMLTGTTAQSTEISNALKSIMSKMGIPTRTRGKKGKTGGLFRSRRNRVFDSNDQESAVERYPFQEFDASLLQLSERDPSADMFTTTQYATEEECNTQVSQMLYIIESMLEDDRQPGSAEEATTTYSRINYCGPNPNVMSEKENVLRAKSEFKLIKYFISVPDASSVEAESWLSKVSSRTEKLIDTAETLHEAITASAEGGQEDATSAE